LTQQHQNASANLPHQPTPLVTLQAAETLQHHQEGANSMKVSATLLLCAASLSSVANATVLTFDDLSGAGPMPNGYAGFNWSGWYHYDHFDGPFYQPKSGSTRITDPGNTGSNNSFSSASEFVFDGASFSGPTATTLHYQLYRGSDLVHTSPTVRMTGSYMFVPSGYSGAVTKVTVLAVVSDQYVMDDVVISAVPEPETYALALMGIAAVAFHVRRRGLASAPQARRT
jgi:hypothetical protein